MRKMSELWELVLEEYIDWVGFYGLCDSIRQLEFFQHANSYEVFILLKDLKDNRPDGVGAWYWPINDSESRINFIKERIAHHKQIEEQ